MFIREILRWNFSPERLSTRYAQGTAGLAAAAYRDGAIEFPTVPADDNIVNSPGTRLAYRLPIEISGWSRFFGLLTIALVWNALFVVFLCFQFPADAWTSWVVLPASLPFAALGGYLIWLTIRAARETLGVAPTQIELSDHPLRPDRPCRLALRQTGNFRLRGFTIELLCEETAVYRQGTDTRIEKRIVVRLPLFADERRAFGRKPVRGRVRNSPAARRDAQFSSAHNAVEWRLSVVGKPDGRPAFKRSYPLVVCPSTRREDNRPSRSPALTHGNAAP
ncbi:MAG: hypothetical protein QM811_24170 [Pirellulales bacterium]